jgi:iron complex outermembrane receptor protein
LPPLSLFVALVLSSPPASAQTQTAQSPWKQLSIEELLDIDVTTAARRPDSIRRAAAAVQVLTGEDLHRAGIRYLSEALRLADAFYVGRFDGRTWVVNTRGLNINGTNKLQVMIDGRTIYSPLFSGIFWDAQDVLIDDVERIEIIRGPGASLWGANAVHGTVNVITRRAADTQGTLVTLGSGNEELAIGDVRYGGRTANGGAYRLYAKYGYRDAQVLVGGGSAHDPMRRGQMGGRFDWEPSKSTDATLQGDAYVGRLGLIDSTDTSISGGNVLGRWGRKTPRSALQLTAFYDVVQRHVPDQFGEVHHTFDLDAQETRAVEDVHSLVWGGGYRVTSDILTPRTMEYLLSVDAEGWRTCGSDLVGFAQGRLDPAEVVRTAAVLGRVQDGIPGFVWTDAGVPNPRTRYPGGATSLGDLGTTGTVDPG